MHTHCFFGFSVLVKFFYSHSSRYGLFQLPEDMSGRVMRSVWSQIVWKMDEKWVGRAEQGAMASESLVSQAGAEALGAFGGPALCWRGRV